MEKLDGNTAELAERLFANKNSAGKKVLENYIENKVNNLLLERTVSSSDLHVADIIACAIYLKKYNNIQNKIDC